MKAGAEQMTAGAGLTSTNNKEMIYTGYSGQVAMIQPERSR